MLILLPPSETKRESLASDLHETATQLQKSQLLAQHLESYARAAHQETQAALIALSRNPDSSAYKTLKLKPGAKADAALAANCALDSAAKIPAILRYTGVLYDALNVTELELPTLEWLAEHLAVQSALYGIIAANTPIANYRLSGGSKLPQLNTTLKKHWQQAYAGYPWNDHGFILDLRSNEYVSLAPLSGAANSLQPQFAKHLADGTLQQLNHFNKAAKGRLVAQLAVSAEDITGAERFIAWLKTQGYRVAVQNDTAQITIITQ